MSDASWLQPDNGEITHVIRVTLEAGLPILQKRGTEALHEVLIRHTTGGY